MGDAATEQLDRAPQDDRRRHAIHVVVAVNRDRFPVGDGGVQPVHGLAHAGQQKGIVELSELGLEEAPGRVGIA